MLLLCSALLAGFLILFWSADHFVNSAVEIAKYLTVSPMLIGLTIVSLGTSAPEIFVSITSSIEGSPELAVGNALGSNIANVGLVLGFTAIIMPLPFRKHVLRHDLPSLLLVTLAVGGMLLDQHLGLIDGLILLLGLYLFCWRLYKQGHDQGHSRRSRMSEAAIMDLHGAPKRGIKKSVLLLIVALLLLLASAEVLVWAATGIAQRLEVSPLVIGLTVIAVGTSLPELVVSLTSSTKGETDLAVGNIVGSNIFNMLAVLAIPCILAPSSLGPEVLRRDYLVMLAMTVLLLVFAYGFSNKVRITRLEGSLIFAGWLTYLWFVYQATVAP